MTQTVPDTSVFVKEALSLVCEDNSLFGAFQAPPPDFKPLHSPPFTSQSQIVSSAIPTASSSLLTSLSSRSPISSSATSSPFVMASSPHFPSNLITEMEYSSPSDDIWSTQFQNEEWNEINIDSSKNYDDNRLERTSSAYSYGLHCDVRCANNQQAQCSAKLQRDVEIYQPLQPDMSTYPDTTMTNSLAGLNPRAEKKIVIPADPLMWRPCHVISWLRWIANEHSLHHIDLSRFEQVDGTVLCQMSVDDFTRSTTRYNGEVLVQHIKYLKQASLRQMSSIKRDQLEVRHQSCTNGDYNRSYQNVEYSRGNKLTIEETYKLLGPLCSRLSKQGGGQIQLWQFLLELLSDAVNASCVTWEGTSGEFKMTDPDEVARRWGKRKSKPNMNYDKMSRALRYYYDKQILTKVHGKRYAYKFDFQGLAQVIQAAATPDRYGYTYTHAPLLPCYGNNYSQHDDVFLESANISSSTSDYPTHKEADFFQDSCNTDPYSPLIQQQGNSSYRNPWKESSSFNRSCYDYDSSQNYVYTSQYVDSPVKSDTFNDNSKNIYPHYFSNYHNYESSPVDPSTTCTDVTDNVTEDLTHSSYYDDAVRSCYSNNFTSDRSPSGHTSFMTPQHLTSPLGTYSCTQEANSRLNPCMEPEMFC